MVELTIHSNIIKYIMLLTLSTPVHVSNRDDDDAVHLMYTILYLVLCPKNLLALMFVLKDVVL